MSGQLAFFPVQERRRSEVRYLDPPEPAWLIWGTYGVVGSTSIEVEWWNEPIMRKLATFDRRSPDSPMRKR